MTERHGHLVPRPDGLKARCGGPALCPVCLAEKNAMNPEPDALTILADDSHTALAPTDPRPESDLPGSLAPVPGTGVSA